MKTKTLIYFRVLVLLFFSASIGNAQNRNVGIGTITPNESAILDIKSDSKGLLIPRLTKEQKLGIASPANGLMIYQVDETAGFYYFNGSQWTPMNKEESKSLSGVDGDWTLFGNSITGSEFLGTTNAQPLIFKVDGLQAGLLDMSNNSFFGRASGMAISGGQYNVGIGYTALNANSTGGGNVAVGSGSLSKNTVGSANVAIGDVSMSENLGGTYNIALGSQALRNGSAPLSNVAIGSSSLQFSNGGFNTAIGEQAGMNNTSGSNNLFLGKSSGKNSLGSNNIFIGNAAGENEGSSDKLYISNSNTLTPLLYGDFSAKYVTIGDVTPALRTQGTATGGYNLLVKGGILTEKVKVALAAAGTDWADYVFEPAYKAKMMPLEEVEKFTLKNKHLPNVPSAEEMVKSGLDVSQTSKMFMEKIEELTLYMIELNKEVKALKAENELLKRK
jgi:hypothetical protein